MTEPSSWIPSFESTLAPLLKAHILEKRLAGYRYQSEAWHLLDLDRFLCQEAHASQELPRTLVERWCAKRENEAPKTCQNRVGALRQFARFLLRQAIPAALPAPRRTAQLQYTFVPFIFTFEQIQRLLREVDQLPPSPQLPLQHLVMPEVFRLLYGCGLRRNEARNLLVADVNLDSGVLTLRDTKFGKDRLVPVADSLVHRLRVYASRLGERENDAPFFSSADGRPLRVNSLYVVFRRVLPTIGITHGGKGHGPRLHDLRHTFAVHRLIQWYREGADLQAKLPLLATYLGHQGMSGTQRYLHLVPELFPEVTATLERFAGHVIPQQEIH